jgi:hypothetical protein
MSQVSEGVLHVTGTDLALPLHRNVVLLAFGKAVLGMTQAADRLLGQHLRRGVCLVRLYAVFL